MSAPHVTITLGRSGQVVKRGGSNRFTGSDSLLPANKRRRVGNLKRGPENNSFDDSGIAQNDLRLKLMRKRHIEEQKKRELSYKLSKAVLPPADDSVMQRVPAPNRSGLLRQLPSRETLDDLALRKYYTSQTMDVSRVRSPLVGSSRGLSPPRNSVETQQVPVIRAADVSGAGRFFSNEVANASRMTAFAAVNTTSGTAMPVAPTSAIMPKNSHTGMEPLTVASLLHSLGLGKYAILFQAEEVDMTALKQMGDMDLKELGIPMGPRKKILLALRAPPKRQPP